MKTFLRIYLGLLFMILATGSSYANGGKEVNGLIRILIASAESKCYLQMKGSLDLVVWDCSTPKGQSMFSLARDALVLDKKVTLLFTGTRDESNQARRPQISDIRLSN